MHKLTCREVTELKPNDSLWLQWKALQKRVRPELALFGPEWFLIWSQTIGSGNRWTGKLRLLVVTDNQGIMRGIKVIAEKKYGILCLQCCGGFWVPQRPILAESEYEAEVGQAIGVFIANSGWWLFMLAGFYASNTAEAACLETLNNNGVRFVKKDSWLVSACRVPPTWEEYKQQIMGGKLYRNIGYRERKMAKMGTMKIVHTRRPDASQTRDLITQFCRVEQQSWLVRVPGGRPRFIDDVEQHFWTRLIDEMLSPNDYFDAWVIHMNDLPVSFCMTITCGETRYVTFNHYDEAVSDFSTGSILYRYMIEEGFQRGIRTLDFSIGAIDYKKYWGARRVDQFESYLIAPHRLSAPLLRLAVSARNWIDARRAKQIKECTPVGCE